MDPYQIEKWMWTMNDATITGFTCIWMGIGDLKPFTDLSLSLCISIRFTCTWGSTYLYDHTTCSFALKFHSSHWNGCHHKQIDFCRFVERIKNRFYGLKLCHSQNAQTFRRTNTNIFTFYLIWHSSMQSTWSWVFLCDNVGMCVMFVCSRWPFLYHRIQWFLIFCGQMNDLWSFIGKELSFFFYGNKNWIMKEIESVNLKLCKALKWASLFSWN